MENYNDKGRNVHSTFKIAVAFRKNIPPSSDADRIVN